MPPIYTEQPPGYEEDGGGKVCLLYKAIYGLKQASRIWYQTICNFLLKCGFKVSKIDAGLFYRFTTDGEVTLLGIYVDDPFYLGNRLDRLLELEKEIQKKFDFRILGELDHYLGIKYSRDWEKGTISANQGSYIDAATIAFNLESASPVDSPLNPGQKIGRDRCPTDPDEITFMKRVPYRELIGLLMYIANGTRPDICYAVNMLAQVASNPGRVHWEAAKRVVRYLKGTRDKCLTWGASSEGLVGYTDASHASEDLGYKSMSGYVVLFGGGAISWSAKKQTLVALSTAESEYIAMTHAAKELYWLHSLISEVFQPLSGPLRLRADNQSAIALAVNGYFSPRTKHIALRYHFIREAIEHGIISLTWVGTHSNIADLFTKALDSSKHTFFSSELGLHVHA